jgi:hypothetical protein
MVGFAICLISAMRFADVGGTLDRLAIALDEFSTIPPGEHERAIFRSAAHLIMAHRNTKARVSADEPARPHGAGSWQRNVNRRAP